jgi:hypothetical protein
LLFGISPHFELTLTIIHCSFFQERAALIDEGKTVGPAIFFFGCRTRKQDYIYEDELADYVNKGALSSLIVAFSREGVNKDYVQHKMVQEVMFSTSKESLYFNTTEI